MKPDITSKGYNLELNEILKAMGVKLSKDEFIYSTKYDDKEEVLRVIVSDAEREEVCKC